MALDIFSSRGRVGPAKVLTFITAGFAAGIILGYIFMGAVHAVSVPSLPAADVLLQSMCGGQGEWSYCGMTPTEVITATSICRCSS